MDGTKNRILLLSQLAVQLTSRRAQSVDSLLPVVLPAVPAISLQKLPQLAVLPAALAISLPRLLLPAALATNNCSVLYPKAVPGGNS